MAHRESKQRTFREFPIGYQRILRRLYFHLSGYEAEEVRTAQLATILKQHRIKSLLEIGVGAGTFLRTLSPVFREAGLLPTGIDLTFDPFAIQLLEEHGIQAIWGDASKLDHYVGSRKFDLIIAVGVFSLGSLLRCPTASAGQRRNRIVDIERQHLRLIQTSLDHMSENPKSAFFSSAVKTFLILSKLELKEHARVLHWTMDDRKREKPWFHNQLARFTQAYSLSNEEQSSYRVLWHVGADTVVIAGN